MISFPVQSVTIGIKFSFCFHELALLAWLLFSIKAGEWKNSKRHSSFQNPEALVGLLRMDWRGSIELRPLVTNTWKRVYGWSPLRHTSTALPKCTLVVKLQCNHDFWASIKGAPQDISRTSPIIAVKREHARGLARKTEIICLLLTRTQISSSKCRRWETVVSHFRH